MDGQTPRVGRRLSMLASAGGPFARPSAHLVICQGDARRGQPPESAGHQVTGIDWRRPRRFAVGEPNDGEPGPGDLDDPRLGASVGDGCGAEPGGAGVDQPLSGLLDADRTGTWMLPVVGAVSAPTAVLIRPDGHVAWVGNGTRAGLSEALTTWFGPPTTAAPSS